jgi:hypothetical protein
MHVIHLVTALACLAAATAASAETATARVVEVGESNGIAWVRLSVGRIDGLGRDDPVMLLRQAAPIVHPLTGEVLGVPEEPVGLLRVESLGEQQAQGRLIRSYTAPRVGDVAEYQRRVGGASGPAAPPSEPPSEPEPTGRADGPDARAAAPAGSERARADHEPTTAGHAPLAVWDELASMQHYLRSIERRLDTIEREHREAASGPSLPKADASAGGDTRELTIRYSAGTDVRLRLAGHTLLVSVEPDSLRLTEAAPTPEPRVEPVPVAPLPPLVGADGRHDEGGSLVPGTGDASAVDAGPAGDLSMTPAGAATPSDCTTAAVAPRPEAPAAAMAAEPDTLASSAIAAGLDGAPMDTLAQEASATLGRRLMVWLTSPYAQAGSLVVIAAMAGVLFYLMRRREDNLTAQLAELDDGLRRDDGPEGYLR